MDNQQVEEWRPVVDYENDYEVSNFGRVRAKPRTVKHRYGVANRNEHVMTPTVGKRKYAAVSIHVNGKLKTCVVHRMVARAFLAPDPDRLFVNHKDGVKTNNRLDNLEWTTRSENARHLFDILGFKGASHGTKGGTSSKVVVALNKNNEVIHAFESGAAAAKFLHVTPTAVSNNLKGKSKTCGSYQFVNINRLDEERADQAIAKLRKAIEDREGTTSIAQ